MGAQDRFAQEGFHAGRSLDGKLTTRLDEGRASYSPEAASRQGAGRRCLASPSCSAHGCSAPCLVLRNSATAGGSTDGRFYLNPTPAEIPQLGRHCWLTFLFLLLFYFFFFLTVHFCISCLRAGREEETPKILQDELVRGTSKGWRRKGLAGEAQAARNLCLFTARTLVADRANVAPHSA